MPSQLARSSNKEAGALAGRGRGSQSHSNSATSGYNRPARTRALARLDPSGFRRDISRHSSRIFFHTICYPERLRDRSTRRDQALLTTASCTSPPQNSKGSALPLIAFNIQARYAHRGGSSGTDPFRLGPFLRESAWSVLQHRSQEQLLLC